MNNISKKGFTSLSALLLTSLLVSLGGVSTAVAFQQSFPDTFREELGKILGKIDHVDEVSAVTDVTPTPTPTGATGISGATGSSGATETTGVRFIITPTPKLTGVIRQGDDEIDDQEDKNEDELDDDYIQHATGATGAQLTATSSVGARHSRDDDN